MSNNLKKKIIKELKLSENDFKENKILTSNNNTLNLNKKMFGESKDKYNLFFIINQSGKITGEIPFGFYKILLNDNFNFDVKIVGEKKHENIDIEDINIGSLKIYKNKKNLKITKVPYNSLYFQNCENISIKSDRDFLCFFDNCKGRIQINRNEKKSCPKPKECPEPIKCPEPIECPEPIKCPKPNYIYYQGALGSVILALFILIIYNIFSKCKTNDSYCEDYCEEYYEE